MSSLPRIPRAPRTPRSPLGVRALALGFTAVLASMFGASGTAAGGGPQIGRPAPDFTATDSKGSSVSLSEFRGRTVVLEWTNADCPYTRKHYTSGNMQGLQALAQKNGVVLAPYWRPSVPDGSSNTAVGTAPRD